MRWMWLGLIASLGMGSSAQAAGPQDDAAKGCEFCHGAQGNGSYDLIPRLNGQQFEYLMARLKDFGQVTPDTARGINTMAHAADVAEPLRSQIANYFARQSPTAAKHDSPNWRLGEEIYENGIPAAKVTACQTCHGPGGQGKGLIPRLAGQHASYLKTRMWILSRFDLPGNHDMHKGTANISSEQMDAVIAYLANN
jgi:cytochrome c553